MAYQIHAFEPNQRLYASDLNDMDLQIEQNTLAHEAIKRVEINNAWDMAKTSGTISRMNTYQETLPTDKVYMYICQDDGLGELPVNVATSYGLPMCLACIPENVDSDMLVRMNTIVGYGGEILAHTSKWIANEQQAWQDNYDAEENRIAYNTAMDLNLTPEGYANTCMNALRNRAYLTRSKEDMFDLFVNTKAKIEALGFKCTGMIKAGASAAPIYHTGTTIPILGLGSPYSRPDGICDNYVRTFYDYSDYYGQDYFNEHESISGSACYHNVRSWNEGLTAEEVLSAIDECYENRANGNGLKCWYFHGIQDREDLMNETKLRTIFAGIAERVNDGKLVVTTPREYYKKFSSWKY